MTDSILMAELLEEICQRLEAGERVDVGQYAAKHPQLASQLEELVPAMAMLGDLSKDRKRKSEDGSRNSDVGARNTPEGRGTPKDGGAPPVLGDFRIVREIGRGGMGVVYEAEQVSLTRHVAVKILPFAALWPETTLQRFRQEVRIAALLEHPHIVPIYGVGCEQGVHFYVMKLIQGCSLADVIKFRQAVDEDDSPSRLIGPMGPMGPMDDANRYRAAAQMGRAAAEALSFAHQNGVIHRDIKPSNLLLDQGGRLFIADFGLARFDADVNLTRTGDVIGTPRYMSPEQATGDSKRMDARTDIYSLGATLYELITSHPVIAARGPVAAAKALRQLKVIPPRTYDRRIPRPLEQIVLRCLQVNPADRYGTAAELADDLQRFLDGLPIAARHPGLVRRGSRWLQRHPRMSLGIIASIVTCLIVAAVGSLISLRRITTALPLSLPAGDMTPPNASSTSQEIPIRPHIPGLISHWTGDNTSADSVGTNHGTLVQGAKYAPGQFGQAFSFDGVDDRVRLPDSDSLALTRSLTIEGWVLVNAIPAKTSNGEILFRGDDRGGMDPYAVSINPNSALHFLVTPTANQGVTIDTPVTLGHFFHFAGTLDDATGAMRLYINGILKAERITTIRPFGELDSASNPGIGIGNHGGHPKTPHNFPFHGLIDELRVYDRALAAEEVLEHFNSEKGSLRPAISIGDVKIAEGDPALHGADRGQPVPGATAITVSLSFPGNSPISVDYATSDGTAIAGSDYVATKGTVMFAPGTTTQIIQAQVLDDARVEIAEKSFTINLTNSSGGVIGDKQAVVTVVDDEAQRAVSIENATASEGSRVAHYRGGFAEGAVQNNFSMLTFGPDGTLYTTTGGGPGANTIRRYHGTTGEFLGTFIEAGIRGVRDMVFREGHLYVGSEYSDEVLRFHATTGKFVDAFVTAGSGGIDGPHGLTFGPDANGDGVPELYVSGRNSFSVVRYDGVTGQPVGEYVSRGSGGLSWPEAMTFDSRGEYLFVASTGSNQILEYQAQTGAFVGIAASTNLAGPKDVKFGPDGLMYVTSGANDRIPRFTSGGVYLDDFVPASSAGMDNPTRLAFGPDGNLFVTALGNQQILRFGTEAEVVFTVTRQAEGTVPVSVDFVTSDGTATAGSDYAAVSGTLTFPPGITTKTIRVPLLDDSENEGHETFYLNLSPSSDAILLNSQAIATIRDNDITPRKP